MLSALSIRDIVLISELDIEFADGMVVLTGETGAGKSILLDALSLALGARGDGDLVRLGQGQGQVRAIFDVDGKHKAYDLLRDNDLVEAAPIDPIILRRTQSADGRTRAYINDQPVSVSLLKAVGRELVEIHGQHEERAMVDPATHRDLVDAFGGLDAPKRAVAEAYGEWRKSARAVKELENSIEQAARDAEYLRSSVEELRVLAPQEGEEEELAGRRQTMMAAERIATDLDEAFQTLAGSASPVPKLVSTLRTLERKAEDAPGLLNGAIENLGGAIDSLALAENDLERALRLSEFDPNELERAEERLFALRAASRKYKVPVESLAHLAAELEQNLTDLDAGEERLEALRELERHNSERLLEVANSLSEARDAAGKMLASHVMKELPALKLETARFFVDVVSNTTEITAQGCDLVEFKVQTNPGTRPGAMMKVASGGELSRFLLALKVALADRGSAPTLIFDEIDTGVGGAVADAIGGRLRALSRHVQVLAVTHAPQVASRASEHFLISKNGEDSVQTRVHKISGTSRLEEVARMLSGAEVTEEARAAASRLMQNR